MSTLSVWKKFSIGALSWQPPVRLIDGVAFIAASWHVEEPRDFEVSGYARRSKIVLSGEFMVSPPSATRNEPVMNAASSEARKSVAFAISSGSPKRVRWRALIRGPITSAATIEIGRASCRERVCQYG